MAKVECLDLTKEFDTGTDTVTAVDGVDLAIADGTFTSIVGPSGCGKTTLLRMIAGLETPTDGRIMFDSDDVTSTSPQNRNVSMVFQDIALFPFKTVRENIAYGLKYKDVDGDVDSQVEEIAEILDIAEHLDKKPGQLSGGQQQRAGLGRSLIQDPAVFLLDEPMSDLDAKLKREMRKELKKLHQQFRNTTLYVTHDQEEAMTLSDDVIVMNKGTVAQKSTPYEIYHRPNSIFVAEFIGSPSINTFDATVQEGALSSPQLTNELPVGEKDVSEIAEAASSGDVVLGIRPTDMYLTDTSDEARISGEVKIYEQMGENIVIHLQSFASGTEFKVVADDSSLRPDPGETFDVGFDVPSVHVFDRKTERAILHGFEGTQAQIQND